MSPESRASSLEPRWDPQRYLEFSEARLRPAIDLLGRIDGDFTEIWDLGCGTGMVTTLLAERWPNATVHGLDSSPDMLAVARRIPDIDWVLGDLRRWHPPEAVDLVVANAVLQWVEGHLDLLPGLLGATRVLAVQVPNNFAEPSHRILAETAASPEWRDRLGHLDRGRPVATVEAYYDALAQVAATIDIWETEYVHVLDGDDPVARWVAATAARPHLEVLGLDGDRFLRDYARRVADAYPRRPDGVTLFPFRRLFFVASARPSPEGSHGSASG